MATMAILDVVRLALRWRSTSLDTEINRYIDWSKAEMERAGVPSDIASSDTNPLIRDCIVQGCLKNLSTDERIRDAADKAFLFQLDNLRKHQWPDPNEEPEPEPEPEPNADTEGGAADDT